MAHFPIIDNNIFSIFLMLLIICNIYTGKRNEYYTSKYMLFMCWSTIAVLIVDLAAWLALSVPGRLGFFLVYLFNYLLFLLNPTTAVFWLMYCYAHLKRGRLSSREFCLLSLPFAINLIPMVLTIFTGFVFWVDEFNQDHRGAGVYVVALIDYSAILTALVIILSHRDRVSRRFMAIVIAFSTIPLVGSLLQIIFYGISTSWPSIALGILLTYIFMEVQKNLRDHLTGLMNRRQFEELINNRMSRYSQNRNFTLVLIDLNRFKAINDTHGHEAGDRALQVVAMLLSRSVDMKDTVARLGGDEFVLLLDRVEEWQLDGILMRLRESLAHWNRDRTEPFSLSMSMGYVRFDSKRHRSFSDIFREADEAMYLEKRQSRSSLS
ncbi:MAG: GGDEF domain-containing protein [Spirochaetales bacterium]|nr:GGDEF domain-containing protein [Spirochaetales bacterium]